MRVMAEMEIAQERQQVLVEATEVTVVVAAAVALGKLLWGETVAMAVYSSTGKACK
jgi:hypothetical protein